MIPAQLQQHIRASYRKRKLVDFTMRALIVAAAFVVLVPLGSVIQHVFVNGISGINWAFFTQLPKPVGEAGGGLANALVGSLILVIMAGSVGIPIGMATGIYLSEFGSGRLGTVIRFGTDMLASIPSIVIGLFVYSLVVVPMGRFSSFAGGVALGIIMIPTVARSSEEMLRLVPTHIREAGLALGLPRWKVIVRIVLRGALGGILTGIMLAVARVAGETAPLLFTALSNRVWVQRLDEPIASLPVQIYTYAIAPFADWHEKAWAAALVLVFFVFAINVITRTVLRPSASPRE